MHLYLYNECWNERNQADGGNDLKPIKNIGQHETAEKRSFHRNSEK